jgi:hypothetical protein
MGDRHTTSPMLRPHKAGHIEAKAGNRGFVPFDAGSL